MFRLYTGGGFETNGLKKGDILMTQLTFIERYVNVVLNKKEDDFIKWLGRKDNLPYSSELRRMFMIGLAQEMSHYDNEFDYSAG